MRYLGFLKYYIGLLFLAPSLVQSQEIEVFAVTREMGMDYPGAKKPKSEFDGVRKYLEMSGSFEWTKDSVLDLTRVSTSFFNEFYI